MFSFAEKYNKGHKFDVDTTGYEYISLEQLYKENGEQYIYKLMGVYINTKGMYSDSPVFIIDNYLVNCPSHMTNTCNEILSDTDSVDSINDGRVGFQIYTYMSTKYNKKCYGVNFIDL